MDRPEEGQEHPPLAPGAPLGRLYRITRHIGRGGQGDVYEVVHERLGARFAAKVLLPHATRSMQAVQRFEREAIAASRLEHPNIARVVNFEHTDHGEPFAIMELLEGEDLGALIQRGPIAAAEVCRIAMDIAAGIEAAHVAGVVHRDLKPSNVLLVHVDGKRVVKVTDFGISKVFEPEDGLSLTKTGALVGTPMYMAPEQARGEEVDARTDVYALGLVMIEMLRGQPPYEMVSAMKLIVKKATEPSPDPRRLVPGLAPGLAELVAKAIATDPRNRWASMRELRGALAAELDVLEARVEPTWVKTESIVPRAGGRSWTRPVAVVALAIAGAAVAVAYTRKGERVAAAPPVIVAVPDAEPAPVKDAEVVPDAEPPAAPDAAAAPPPAAAKKTKSKPKPLPVHVP